MSTPWAPTFFDDINTGERGAEGLESTPASESPTEKALRLVGYEVDGAVGVYSVIPEARTVPAGIALLVLAGAVWRRRRPVVD